jgi:hypothetical protein
MPKLDRLGSREQTMAFRSLASGHLREVLGWTPAAPLNARTIAIAALGMAAPVIVGLALGKPHLGFTIGLGAMLLADQSSAGAAASQDRPSAFAALLPAALAVTLATLIAGGPWTDPAMILLAAVAATISGYSRPVAVTAIRFIVYLVLSVSLLDSAGGHRTAVALVFGLGALWNMAIRMLLRGPAPQNATPTPARKPTPAQLRAHWRRTMREFPGWQFPIRILAGLGAASLLRHLWPSHHFFWIVLTVALLTQRPLEHVPVKITQRAVGSLLGVGLTWAILASVAWPLGLAAIICVLGAAAPLARSRSYLVYSVISTPVILMVMDLGKPVATALLTDRLAATLMGAVIVVVLNIILERVTTRPTPPAPNAVSA